MLILPKEDQIEDFVCPGDLGDLCTNRVVSANSGRSWLEQSPRGSVEEYDKMSGYGIYDKTSISTSISPILSITCGICQGLYIIPYLRSVAYFT